MKAVNNSDKVKAARVIIDQMASDKLAGKTAKPEIIKAEIKSNTDKPAKKPVTVKAKAAVEANSDKPKPSIKIKAKADKKVVVTKQQGTRRVAANTAKSEGVKFVGNAVLAPAAKATIEAANNAVKALTITSDDLTPLGRKLVGPNPAAGNIDMWLIKTAKSGDIDLKGLYETIFNLVSTTSRVEGMTPGQKVAASYNRIVEHLACLQPDNKYSLPSMVKLGYTQGQANKILAGIAPLAQAVRVPFLAARKAAVKAAKVVPSK